MPEISAGTRLACSNPGKTDVRPVRTPGPSSRAAAVAAFFSTFFSTSQKLREVLGDPFLPLRRSRLLCRSPPLWRSRPFPFRRPLELGSQGAKSVLLEKLPLPRTRHVEAAGGCACPEPYKPGTDHRLWRDLPMLNVQMKPFCVFTLRRFDRHLCIEPEVHAFVICNPSRASVRSVPGADSKTVNATWLYWSPDLGSS